MMNVIVGGRAMKWHGLRNPNYQGDWDIWTSKEWDIKFEGMDVCVMPKDILLQFKNTRSGYASLDDLYTIKLSHLPYDIFWWKHVQDILLLKKHGAKINQTLYDKLKDHWKSEHGGSKSHLSLYQSKDQFFDDFVPKQYEHDYLHELVAFPAQPMYISCLKDGEDVFIDKDKWNLLSFEQKVRMMKEEIAVIALERWLIPSLTKKNNQFTIQQSWNRSVHKTVTRLTKGEFSCFIVENIEEFLNPLEKEMLHTLEVLNLKEIYMTNKINFVDFIEMVDEILVEEGFPHEWEEKWNEYDILHGDFPENSRVEFIKREGGGEGGTEDCYSVIKVDGVFYKVTYSYYSHYGFETDYAEVFVVSPKKKIITVYE